MKLKNFFGHLKTILKHKKLVRRHCFKSGLFAQGIRHDWSKYSPIEFWTGVRYFQGNRSPNDAERQEIGYSAAWLHHKGRNKHHWEYWMDYVKGKGYVCVPMPPQYVAEMVCDRIAACKTYNGEKYTVSDPLNYYLNSKVVPKALHPDTAELLESLLRMVQDEGEEATFRYIKQNIAIRKK